MKLEKWASIAEIVSGVAVVVTLIFLVLGIRDNSNIMRASNFTGASDGLIEFSRDIMNDDELVEIFEAWWADETSRLDDLQMAKLMQMAGVLFRQYEKAFIADQYDLLGPGEWARFEETTCSAYALLSDPDLRERVRLVLTDDFVRQIDESCGPSSG